MAWVVAGAENIVAPVVVQAGSGQYYSIDVYANGMEAPPTETGTQARHYRISDNETIPAGTTTFAVRAGGHWHLMEAVWL